MAESKKRQRKSTRERVPVLLHMLWDGQDPATVCCVITRDEWRLLRAFNLSYPHYRAEEVQRDTPCGRLLRRLFVYIERDGKLVEDEGYHGDGVYPVEPESWVGKPYRHIFCYAEE